MTDAVPAAAITAAAEAIHEADHGAPRACSSQPLPWHVIAARAALEAAAPHITAAERQRLAAVMGPEQFRKLAGWFDTDDEFKEAMFPETWSPGSRKDEVQQDLRRFADLLDGKP